MFASFKGWIGERATSLGLFLTLDRKVYRRIDDLILVTADGGTTQIDHVIVSRYGIFVIETKNMKGWIFGSEHDACWTQVNFGRKDRFQNPIRQNHRHCLAIAEKLGVDRETVHSVVFFIGDCRFQTEIPNGVLTHGLCGYIRRYGLRCFVDEEVERFEARLREIKQYSRFTKADHIHSLRERYESAETCPKCGAALLPRVAKKGANAGGRFLGCSAYPKCRYTRDA